jgi:hypothetical protein
MKKSLLLCAVFFTPALHAWNCENSKTIEQNLDLSGSEALTIEAKAGELEVSSAAGTDAVIRGKVCVSKEKWLDESKVLTKDGRHAHIAVDLPETSGWSLTGNNYAYMDLVVEVPAGLAVTVKDSSGDAEISGVASLNVSDSSGDLDISDIEGSVVVKDSSGDIELEDIGGDVTIANDSSGDIDGERITGAVLVENDSSGSIYFEDVGKDFTVERDSSGDIRANGVGGDFTVLRDGSGDIRAKNVDGKVSTPENS